MDAPLDEVVPLQPALKSPQISITAKMQTLVESKRAVFGNVGINEMLITHSYLGKFLFTRRYPFCRNSDEMYTVISVLTVARGRQGKAREGFRARMCLASVD